MNVNPAELRRIADKLDGALDAYRAAHYRYPTVPNHVETALLSIADDLDDLLAESEDGPPSPADDARVQRALRGITHTIFRGD